MKYDYQTNSYEILAPVGSIDALKAAISAGANAVYFGVNAFNARMSADNFTLENLAEWVRYCHLFSVRVYLTLNIIIKEKELNAAEEVVKAAAAAKVDAIIFQDLSVISMVKEFAPMVELHASTQLGIHNLFGAKFLENLGVQRVVLSRETLLSDIAEIKKQTSLEVECFIHGALCVSFSGNCYASSFINGGSGNRGRCLQTCRLQYKIASFGKPLLENTKIYSMSGKRQQNTETSAKNVSKANTLQNNMSKSNTSQNNTSKLNTSQNNISKSNISQNGACNFVADYDCEAKSNEYIGEKTFGQTNSQYICRTSGEYLLSTSDLNSFNTVKNLISAGVDSFKIEGRMRSPHYVFSAVTAYKNLLAYGDLSSYDKFSTETAFNRGGYTKGYNFDDESKLMSTNVSGNIGALIGTIEKKLQQNKYVLTLQNPEIAKNISIGDGVKVFYGNGEVGGGKINSIESNSMNAKNGQEIKQNSTANKVGEQAKSCYKTSDKATLTNNCRQLIIGLSGDFATGSSIHLTSMNSFKIIDPKISITIEAVGYIGSPLQVTASLSKIHQNSATKTSLSGKNIQNNVAVTLTGSFIIEESQRAGYEIIKDELSKVGNSLFRAETVSFIGDNNLFIPKCELKNLKNNIILALENEIIAKYDEWFFSLYDANKIFDEKNITQKTEISDRQQSEILCENTQYIANNPLPETMEIYETDGTLPNEIASRGAIIAYYPDTFSDEAKVSKTLLKLKESATGKLYLRLPNICRGNDIDIISAVLSKNIKNIDGILCENLYAVTLAKSNHLDYIAGYFMNVANSISAKIIGANMIVFSSEISKYDMLTTKKALPDMVFFAYSFGKFPLMTLSHCPLKLNKICSCAACHYAPGYAYQDRFAEFELQREKTAHCYFYLLNSVPHFLSKDDLSDIFRYVDCKHMSENDIIAAVNDIKPLKFTKGYIEKNLK